MIKTNIELLNEISAKLGGKSDASVMVEALNNIANALGDTDPDQMVTVPQALQTLLGYVDGGGGGGVSNPSIDVTLVNNTQSGGGISIGVDINYLSIINGILEETGIFAESGQTDSGTFIASYNADAESYSLPLVNSVIMGFNPTASNEVNCTLDMDYESIIVTDPTQNASITITVG